MFWRRRRPEGEGRARPDHVDEEVARARYVVRTARGATLELVLQDVVRGLPDEARTQWASRLAREGVHVDAGTRPGMVHDLLAAPGALSERWRERLGRSVTPEVATQVGISASAPPAFTGFADSPEARQAGVPGIEEGRSRRGRRRARGSRPGIRRLPFPDRSDMGSI